MTDQITVPRATWDAMRGALEKVHYEVINSGVNNYGQLVKHIAKAHDALTAANAVSSKALITIESSLRFRLECEQQKSADLLDEVRELKGKLFKARQPQAQGESWVWNPAITEWEKVRAFGHWQQGAIYAFGSTQPEPLAHPQATEPAGYKLVPVKPTPEMIAAAEQVEDLNRRGTPNTWSSVYRAMLAAAPKTKQ